MRIIGGQWRGRKISSPPEKDQRIRPTSDRVRENLFNILTARFGGSLQGLAVADFCAGTGALGLEALSRSAATCVFVEQSAFARGLIAQNIKTLDAAGAAQVMAADVAHLPSALAPVDLIFFDPPYAATFVMDVMEKACAQGWTKPGTLLCIEQASELVIQSAVWRVDSARKYGATWLNFFSAL